ncbi:hypothetical protein ACYPKM_01255 [Pseudomonas aeruginosa]
MREKNLLLEAMRAGEHVTFDLHGCVARPYSTQVERLLGGVPVKCFVDGTEQFLDVSADPVLIYSPRLYKDDLEAFCKEHIARYDAFNAEHGDEKLKTQRVVMEKFW